MKKQHLRILLSLVLTVLLAAAVLSLTGCTTQPPASPETDAVPVVSTLPTTTETVPAETPASTEDAGTVSYVFSYTDKDGNTKSFDLSTTCSTVGEALLEEGLIEGEDSQYGLYVTTVDGNTLNWDTDGMYWAFYVDGEYATLGVDSTPVEAGVTYEFKAE